MNYCGAPDAGGSQLQGVVGPFTVRPVLRNTCKSYKTLLSLMYYTLLHGVDLSRRRGEISYALHRVTLRTKDRLTAVKEEVPECLVQ